MTPVSRTVLAGMFGLGLGACSTAVAREPEYGLADRPFGDRAVDRTLVVGTLIEATIDSALSWRRAKPGDTLTATVSADVKNARRWVVIPAGCPVGIRVALWDPAADPRRAGAKLLLEVTSVTAWGRVYRVSATVESAPGVVTPGTRILFLLPEGLTVEKPLTVFGRIEVASSVDALPILSPVHNC